MRKPNISILWAFSVNLAVGAIKGAAAWYTGSGAMLAETLHSIADSGNQILLWFGLMRSEQPASTQHPLGHGKEVYFWSFIIAVLLFLGGGVLSVLEGIARLRAPAPIVAPWIAIATLAFALAAEGASLRAALKQVTAIRDAKSFYRWFRDTRRSDLLVVISEDMAAVIGLAIALLAVLATALTGNTLFDAIGSVTVGVLLIIAAGNLIVEVKALLIGESASLQTRQIIEQVLRGCGGVSDVETLITLQNGRDIFVAARIQTPAMNTAELGAIIRCCRNTLRARLDNISHVFIEATL
ncbi:MAG: cation diffusion facilitator family transporter [Burkholderiaceae bacterium]